MAHHNHALEHVRSHQRTETCTDSPEVMANDASNLCVPKSGDQHQHISDQPSHGELGQINGRVWRIIPACRSPVATLVYGNYVEASRRQWIHDFAPGIRKIRVAMQQENEGFAAGWVEASLQDVKGETAGSVRNLARSDALWKRERWKIGKAICGPGFR